MASNIVEICRSDLEKLTTPPDAFVTQVEHVSSYDWIEAPVPTIAVPGCPPRWEPPQGPRQVQKDTGMIYIAQNAARHPESPLEPLFRAMEVTSPSFNLTTIDVVSDRNNIRKLLSFIDPTSSRSGLEAFTITAEAIKNTAIFCRDEAQVSESIAPNEFKGYGHEFEKAFTTRRLRDSTGHHRAVSYHLSDLKLLVRHETDGYTDDGGRNQTDDDNVLQALEAMSLSPADCPPISKPKGSSMTVRREGQAVPIESTLEIKTRVFHKTILFTEVAAQLWVSQTPRLIRAYHRCGRFGVPHVENVYAEVKSWEQKNQKVLRILVALLHKIVDVVKCHGRVQIHYHRKEDQLWIRQNNGKKMLPDDVYLKWERADQLHSGTSANALPQKAEDVAAPHADSDTAIKIGDTTYYVPLSRVPHLAAFVWSEGKKQPPMTEIKHDWIPLFDVALAGLKSGFRQCFRQLGLAIGPYQTLCETYEFLGIDILEGRSFHELSIEIKSGKADFESDSLRDQRLARDSAFRLVFFILRKLGIGAFDQNRLFNDVFYIISHPRTFRYKIRTVVRAAYGSRTLPSAKQSAKLNEWMHDKDAHVGDSTTELSDDCSDGYYYSDSS